MTTSTKQSAYIEAMEARFDRWEAKLDELRASAKERVAEGKIGAYDKVIEPAERMLSDLRSELETAKSNGADALEAMRAGTEDTLRDLQAAFHVASERTFGDEG